MFWSLYMEFRYMHGSVCVFTTYNHQFKWWVFHLVIYARVHIVYAGGFLILFDDAPLKSCKVLSYLNHSWVHACWIMFVHVSYHQFIVIFPCSIVSGCVWDVANVKLAFLLEVLVGKRSNIKWGFVVSKFQLHIFLLKVLSKFWQ